jgi:hypothetical protein
MYFHDKPVAGIFLVNRSSYSNIERDNQVYIKKILLVEYMSCT